MDTAVFVVVEFYEGQGLVYFLDWLLLGGESRWDCGVGCGLDTACSVYVHFGGGRWECGIVCGLDTACSV
jgi:hypothetical protein